MKQKKKNYLYIGLITIILIYFIIIIILLCKSNKKTKYEKFTIFNNKGMKYKTDVKNNIDNKSNIYYYLEQEKINDICIDNFTVFDKNHNKVFYNDGIWDLDEFNMDIISTTGGKLSIITTGENLYSFNINNYEINFNFNYSQNKGKLHIYSDLKEEYDIDFIFKNNKTFLFKIRNDIIANVIKIKNNKNNKNNKIKYKIEYNNSYDQIRQIFVIITIIYLHIIKNFKLKFDDLLL